MKKIEVKTEKFTLSELKEILSEKYPKIGDLSKLKMFNEINFFCIKQFLEDGIPVGYGVIFLGHNSLLSNDISVEDITYWGDTSKVFLYINEFAQELIDSKGLPFKVSDIYYNPNNFIEEINLTFENLNFKKTGRTR